ncbi:hypothetical protein GCM10010103_31730 [Streptomyces paradoxus]|uniref:Uncharacterized protein n=1 Tax=Streptomyces paradoxus TaxID=66375 RepID=A0A7W9TB23_9ACTN|nr:hypothetical protein [Streptomyces paradoxus]MBB6077370.1 hypothetical protein [Streptomyces paradoxus]
MQQHERPPGRRHALAHPWRRPRVRLALATAADGTHAPRADFIGDGIVAVLHPPSDGAKITATGSRTTVSLSASGVSTTGCPNVGADFAD